MFITRFSHDQLAKIQIVEGCHLMLDHSNLEGKEHLNGASG